MFIQNILFIFITCGSSWALLSCSISKTIKLSPVDYSKLSPITSDLPRSDLTSTSLHYNWADITSELDRLTEKYEPRIKMSGSIPDYLPPKSVLDALENLTHNRSEPNSYKIHQYTRGKGHPRLVNVLSKFFKQLMGRTIDPYKEILVTMGASNALDLAARAFLNPGEEVIIFEPFYLMLRTAVENALGKPVFVPLRPKNKTTGENSNNWTFDERELESKINRKTKMILLNNPNNPTGKAFTREELTFIGYLAEKYNLVIVSDEAGLWYQYDKPGHIHIGLFKRTITINSGTKMFSNSGWKIGWAIGPEDMLWAMDAISETSVYAVPTPLQIAYAMALEVELPKYNKPHSYWKLLNERSMKTRNRLVSILRSVGADVIVPSAGYCLVANFTKLADQIDLSSETDCRPGMRFLTFLMKKGIAVNPTSLYYSPQNMWRTEYVVRITNIKTEKTVEEFGKVLKTIFKVIYKYEPDTFLPSESRIFPKRL